MLLFGHESMTLFNTVMCSSPLGHWSEKPAKVGGKAKGGPAAAASGSHCREEDAT